MGAIGVFFITVAVFGVLIFVHELGHFIACRIFGVRVNEFAVGMGPKLLSFKSKKSGTLYSIRVLPIGGFNSIEDGTEETEDENGNTVTVQKTDVSPDAFPSKPVWQRMIIIAAGAIMNFILGFIIMAVIVIGAEKYGSTKIAYFLDADNPEIKIEEFSGLKAGDEVIKVGKRRVHTGDELVYSIFAEGEGAVDVVVKRDGKKITVNDVKFPTAKQQGITFGVINFKIYAEEKTVANTVKQSFFGAVNAITQVFDSLVGMVTGKYGLQHVSGPIGVGEVIGQAAKAGLNSVLNIAVVLSMNLGVFNLLPIPGLDGGKLVFLLIEAIIRRPIPKKIEENATVIGITLLMALVVVVAFKDVFSLIFK